jgi:hypothetical protein
MSLYNVDAPKAKKALLDFSNYWFRRETALYVEGKTSEGCAVVANTDGLFNVLTVSCFEEKNYYCQYTRDPTTDVPRKQK